MRDCTPLVDSFAPSVRDVDWLRRRRGEVTVPWDHFRCAQTQHVDPVDSHKAV